MAEAIEPTDSEEQGMSARRRRGQGHGVAAVFRVYRSAAESAEQGFTLIELLIVLVILPIIIGGIAIAMITSLRDQNGIEARITDSADSQTTSANYVRDVQSAAFVTTDNTVLTPPLCGTGSGDTLIVALQWNNTVVTYWANTTQLIRDFCKDGTTTPNDSSVVAQDLAANQGIATISPAVDASDAASGWTSTQGVAGVTVAVTEQGSGYQYNLLAVPRSWYSPGGGGSPPPSFPPFLLLANPSSCTPAPSPALTMSGGTVVTVGGGSGAVGVDSPCPGSLYFPSGSPDLNASQILTADPSLNSVAKGSKSNPTYPTSETYESSYPINPFASMTVPSDPSTSGNVTCSGSTTLTCPPGAYVANQSFAGDDNVTFTGGNYVFDGTLTISNGAVATFGNGTYEFKGLVDLTGDANVTLGSGIYIFDNGVTVDSGASVVSGSGGVLLYIDGGAASFTGGGKTTLSAMTTGPYSNPPLVIWDAAASGTTNPLTLDNGGSVTAVFGGAVYVPNGEALFNGGAQMTVGAVVASSALLTGGGSLAVG